MGGVYSGPQPLQCFFVSGNYFQVALNSANFHEGSTASGVISFQLNKNTPAVSVYLSIIGYECVMWKRRVRSGKHTRIVTYRDHTIACNQRFQIMQSNDSFVPGQYSYPFTFQVPAGIPGTYVHASGGYSDRAECTCTYTLYAEICHTNSPVGADGMIGRTMCPIVIMQQARTPYNYNMIADMSSKVTTWCCCSRGTANLKCVFEKDVVRIDESVIMRFSADLTECKASLKSVACVLKRKLFLRLRNGFQCYRETDMIRIEVPGIPAGDKFSEDKVVQFDLSKAIDIGTPATLVGALGEFGGKIQQTCNGQLITVSYELHVVGIIDGCMCCAPNPYVFAPIEILAPEKVIMFQPIEYTLQAEVPTNPHAQPLPPKDSDEYNE